MPHRFWGFVRVILLRQFHQSFGSSRFDGIIKFLGKNWWVSSLIVWVIGLVSQLQFDWAFDTELRAANESIGIRVQRLSLSPPLPELSDGVVGESKQASRDDLLQWKLVTGSASCNFRIGGFGFGIEFFGSFSEGVV
ncbi:hypothetical protein CFP56_011989 [Quercus suber]|uniref:Uncharacterized protein n=1 Tax=Quercus suber TaxID=58331 RepID=A0AAW0KZM8_QUESU